MWIPRRFSAALLLPLAWFAQPAAALTILAPASATPGLAALAAPFAAKTGIAVTVAGGARDRIFSILQTGGPADVVVLPSSDFADLPMVNGMTPLGRIGVGLCVF